PASGWAPPGSQPAVPPPAGKPPFDTLGLVSILCNFLPLGGIGQIAAVLVAKKADQERAKLGYPRSTMSAVGRVLGWFFGILIGIGILLAILLPLVLSHHARAGGSQPWTKADNDAVVANTRTAATAEVTYFQSHGTYADLSGLRANGFAPTQGVSVAVLHADRSRFCLQLTLLGKVGWYSSTTDNLSDVARCG
ncbi:MAG: hypothetical protein JWO22_1456, partial [Frankiales bacterium]|nr:hypothetical protein [Frankiales bacterium]